MVDLHMWRIPLISHLEKYSQRSLHSYLSVVCAAGIMSDNATVVVDINNRVGFVTFKWMSWQSFGSLLLIVTSGHPL